MIVIAKAHGILVLLATWTYSPYYDDYTSTAHYKYAFEETNKSIRKVAEDSGAFLFDFDAKMPKERRYWADATHVNEEGARVKAQLFADFILGSELVGPHFSER